MFSLLRCLEAFLHGPDRCLLEGTGQDEKANSPWEGVVPVLQLHPGRCREEAEKSIKAPSNHPAMPAVAPAFCTPEMPLKY